MHPLLIDKVLEGPSAALGLSHIPLILWLLIVFLIFLAFTLLIHRTRSTEKRTIRATPLLLIHVTLLVVGFAISVDAFHYSTLLVVAIILTPFILYSLALNHGETHSTRIVALILGALVTTIMGSRHLVTGVEEHETTSDMINIYLNGHFRWSIHGGHYDLAPLDAILKVMLAYTTGRDIYDAILAAAMYTSYGLVSVLLLYTLIKTLIHRPVLALPVALLVMLSYPYSPLIGLSVPPAPHAHLLIISALTLILRPLLRLGDLTTQQMLSASMLLAAATLMHPSTIAVPLFLTIAIIISLRGEKYVDIKIAYLIILITIIIFIKIIYTSFVTGFTSYLATLWDYILTTFTGREFTITTRNIGYSGLPRLSLTGFGAFLGFVGALALPLLAKAVRKRDLTPLESLFLATVFFYAMFVAASLLSGIGGVSQSRILFNGAQPYVEAVTAIYLTTLIATTQRHALLIPLALASMFALITPNAMPLNYSIPMSRPATINDHLVAYAFTALVDKDLYKALYNSCGEQGRIVASQERGGAAYGLGATQAVTYFFIAPQVIPARSYWDGCVMAIHALPKNVDQYVRHRVFDAWLYAFYLYRPA